MAYYPGSPVHRQRPRSMKDDFCLLLEKSPPMVLSTRVRNHCLESDEFSQIPLFHGKPNEDALYFLREFMDTVSGFAPMKLTDEEMLMKCFPLALKEQAKKWWLQRKSNSFRTWEEVGEAFINRYYPYERTMEIRIQIYNFRLREGERFHEAWDRFGELVFACPFHDMSLRNLNRYFYKALTETFQTMVDITCNGSITKRTDIELESIFETLATNSRWKGSRKEPFGGTSVQDIEDGMKGMDVSGKPNGTQVKEKPMDDKPFIYSTKQVKDSTPKDLFEDVTE